MRRLLVLLGACSVLFAVRLLCAFLLVLVDDCRQGWLAAGEMVQLFWPDDGQWWPAMVISVTGSSAERKVSLYYETGGAVLSGQQLLLLLSLACR